MPVSQMRWRIILGLTGGFPTAEQAAHISIEDFLRAA